jgi:SNF2 family DNA or RNA helicase
MDYKFKTKPFKHQQDCFDRSYDKKFYALLMEMGTGKSKVILDTAAWMFDAGHINAVIIFANKGSYMNWITNEIPVHMPDHIPRKVTYWKANLGKREEAVLNSFFKDSFEGLKIFVVNVEALAYQRSFAVALNFTANNRTLAVIDESTTIKNQDAKRTKSAYLIGLKAVARRIMTGSLVDNNPLDAYSQFEFLTHGCLGFTSYYSFRAQFAELDQMTTRNSPRPFKVVVGYKNIDDLRRRIAQHSFIIKKQECLDLPPKIYQKYMVDLTPEQAQAYVELAKKCITEVQGEMVSVKIVLTKLLRLHQLVCGHLKDDNGVVHEIKNNRIDALLEILEETSGQVIIWANYREDIQAIEKSLGQKFGNEAIITYYGDTSDEERATAKMAFFRGNETKGLRFLVGNPQTGAYGLNLTGANTVIYYSNNFDAEKRNQSEDRAHRIGQTEKVTYIDLVCQNTIDEKILNALKEKKNLADTITLSNWGEFFKS